MAIGIDEAVLLETDGSDWDAYATAGAITDAIRVARGRRRAVRPDPVRQRGRRHRRLPGRDPGRDGARPAGRERDQGHHGRRTARSRRGARRGGGWEVFELPMPAVLGVKEGLNLPRYPSVPGRLRARKKEIRADPRRAAPRRADEGATAPAGGDREPGRGHRAGRGGRAGRRRAAPAARGVGR